MFSKAERERLSQISQELFGSDTHWQRIWKKQRVPDGTTEIESPRYLRLKNGQIITAETAVRRGLLPAQIEAAPEENFKDNLKPQPLTEKRKQLSYRQANFPEFEKAMLTALETKHFSEMAPVQMILTAAVKFLKGELLNMPFLVVGENSQKDFDDLLELIPEGKRAEAKERKVPNGNPHLFCIDGVQFLSDVVFAAAQPEKAAEMLEEYANAKPEEMGAPESVGSTPSGDASAAQA